MKALSLTQPWASLIAIGAKRIETRSWRPDWTGPLAIHATAQQVTLRDLALDFEPLFLTTLGRPPALPPSAAVPWIVSATLPYSAIVCVVELVGCVRTQDVERAPGVTFTERERVFGNYARNRWAWITRDVRRLPEPVHCSGAQGLWDLDLTTEGKVRAQMKAINA